LIVPDTLEALQRLGRAVRRLWNKPVVAVTGSAGKTTTKEAIARLLATKFQVLKSEGNLNNHFGLPLQLLKLEPEHEMAVVELGMNHAGEISALAAIAQPDIGVVTNVAPVHLGFFNSIADIARAKYELIQSLSANGTAVLNADDEFVSQFGRDFAGRVFTYGIGHPAAVKAENIRELGLEGSDFDIVADGTRVRARLPLIGRHNIYNALAAVAVAVNRGLSLDEAGSALALLTPSDKRGQVLDVGGATVINDCYNSNPRALDSVVDALAAMAGKVRKIVVAGEMLELGPATDDLHRKAGEHIAERRIDVLIGVRGAARQMVDAAAAKGMRAEFVETPEEAGEWLAREAKPGDLVLLKASRGVKLEKALERWKETIRKT
jgi:UDP-N-acetylmuramoyl-tripeptide--D-alanyl-D-alanine ligase